MAGNSHRTVVLASADYAIRERVKASFLKLNWQVREANGGAEAMGHLEEHSAHTVLVDNWLPDLEVESFADHLKLLYPGLDVVKIGTQSLPSGLQGPCRHEVLQALREATESTGGDGPAWATVPVVIQGQRGVVINVPDWPAEAMESTQVCGPVAMHSPAACMARRQVFLCQG